MQFREKGLKVLCIRSRYVPEKKRTVGDTVASQDISLSTVTNEVRQQLSNEEVDELQAWLSKRDAKEWADKKDRRLRTLPYFLNNAADALDDSAALDVDNADAVVEALARIKKSLRKRGVKLTKRRNNN